MLKSPNRPVVPVPAAVPALRAMGVALLLLISGVVPSECRAQSMQSPACLQARAELAALRQTGPGGPAPAAARQRAELGRLSDQYRAAGCVRGLFSFLARPAPPQCAAMGQRIQRLEAEYGRVQRQAEGNIRRYQEAQRRLMEAVSRNCGLQPQPRQQTAGFGGFLNSLFGGNRRTAPRPSLEDERLMARYAGTRTVCVRACDGFYFPLNNTPKGKNGADEMCQALCPGAPTAAYRMPNSDRGITRAVSMSGQKYSALPNANQYYEEFVEDCVCKEQDQTWAEVLKPAEKMLQHRSGDVLVTEERSNQMAQPKLTAAQIKQQKEDEKRLAQEEREAAKLSEAVETASEESSGIGRGQLAEATVIGGAEGPHTVISDADGTERVIRIIAPSIIPPPPNTMEN
jgi:hypothetical protein